MNLPEKFKEIVLGYDGAQSGFTPKLVSKLLEAVKERDTEVLKGHTGRVSEEIISTIRKKMKKSLYGKTV